MYPYQGIMKGMSSKEYAPRGKKSIEQAKEFKKSHFEIGQADWKNEYESVTKHFYKPQTLEHNDRSKAKPQTSNFDLVQDPNFDRNKHFKTETQQKFSAPLSSEQRRPTRDKAGMFATNYSLGDERREFVTTSKTLHNDKSKEPTQFLRTHAQPEKYNIITGQNPSVHLQKNTSAFDFYHPEKLKNRTSNNLTDYPVPGRKVDIITGRVLPTSKNLFY